MAKPEHQDRRFPEPDPSKIPLGIYCYDENGKCPYWSRIEGGEPQNDGYCKFMSKGDVDLSGGLLWDQVKECGVNMDWSTDDLP